MNDNTKGFWFCVAAYTLWGILPIYWKWLSHFDSLTILSHRIVWSFVFTFLLLFFFKRLKELKQALISSENLFSLGLRSIFVVSNWLIYVWAINDGNILACSLGYFICPIASVLLGFIFLKERLSKKQTAAIILVLIAVLNLVVSYGKFPWTAISIALTFGIYSLLKKTAKVESLPGLSAETAVLTVPALIFLLYTGNVSSWSQYSNISFFTYLILIGTGIATATPLLFFTFGLRIIKISTAGILQFISPSCTFFIGIFIYKEAFSNSQLITYSIIWLSIGIYIYDMFKKKQLQLFSPDRKRHQPK